MAISTIGTDALASAAVTSAKLASGAPSRSQLPAGTVLQVVQGIYSSQASSSTSTWAASGVTASITPTSSTSKILILVSMQGVGKDTNTTSVDLSIYKNGSSLIQFAAGNTAYTASTATNYPGTAAFNYLDSPATTSATTYAVYFRSNNNNVGVYLQANGSASTITLMEIAA